MKGVKIEKARPSNAIDIYPLLKEALKEGSLDCPSERHLESYYFGGLINELSSPFHAWLLAKRSRGFLGCLHAILLPSMYDARNLSAYVDLVYVSKHRRKNGIAKQLVEEFVKEIKSEGIIRRIDFLCPQDQIEYWGKYGAKPTKSMMRVSL